MRLSRLAVDLRLVFNVNLALASWLFASVLRTAREKGLLVKTSST